MPEGMNKLRMTQIEHRVDRAEGVCHGLPYDTQLASINGVEVIFWVGDRRIDDELMHLLSVAKAEMKNQRDCVRFVWCKGEPTGFWAHDDYGRAA